eukprot:2747235-Pleurochrysis_carterae.AAC.1
MPPPAQRRRTEGVAFAALRPAGAEAAPAREFLRALEEAMEGEGRVTVALAEAAGRPGAIAALTSADS